MMKKNNTRNNLAHLLALLVPALVLVAVGTCSGNGVPDQYGFPNLKERQFLVLLNRVRADPQSYLAGCALSRCADKACYGPIYPVTYHTLNAHASRFHSVMLKTNKQPIMHSSPCGLLSTVPTSYLSGPCPLGNATCACIGSSLYCPCSGPSVRVAMFGGSYYAEDISSSDSPTLSLQAFMYEYSPTNTCTITSYNGHRFSLLKYGPSMGIGAAGYLTIDISKYQVANEDPNLPSGVNVGSTTSPVFYANWYHQKSSPIVRKINIDGTCYDMLWESGLTANNANFKYATTLSSGCHNYYFIFANGTSATDMTMHTYPSAGSLTTGTTCPGIYSSARPSMGTNCAGVSPPITSGTDSIPDLPEDNSNSEGISITWAPGSEEIIDEPSSGASTLSAKITPFLLFVASLLAGFIIEL